HAPFLRAAHYITPAPRLQAPSLTARPSPFLRAPIRKTGRSPIQAQQSARAVTSTGEAVAAQGALPTGFLPLGRSSTGARRSRPSGNRQPGERPLRSRGQSSRRPHCHHGSGGGFPCCAQEVIREHARQAVSVRWTAVHLIKLSARAQGENPAEHARKAEWLCRD